MSSSSNSKLPRGREDDHKESAGILADSAHDLEAGMDGDEQSDPGTTNSDEAEDSVDEREEWQPRRSSNAQILSRRSTQGSSALLSAEEGSASARRGSAGASFLLNVEEGSSLGRKASIRSLGTDLRMEALRKTSTADAGSNTSLSRRKSALKSNGAEGSHTSLSASPGPRGRRKSTVSFLVADKPTSVDGSIEKSEFSLTHADKAEASLLAAGEPTLEQAETANAEGAQPLPDGIAANHSTIGHPKTPSEDTADITDQLPLSHAKPSHPPPITTEPHPVPTPSITSPSPYTPTTATISSPPPMMPKVTSALFDATLDRNSVRASTAVNPFATTAAERRKKGDKTAAGGAGKPAANSAARRMSLGAALCIPPPPRVDNKMNPRKLLRLSFGAIGMVYGDIGVSPMFVLKPIFDKSHMPDVGPQDIMGTLSILLWTITLVCCLKYIIFVIKADKNGEGGAWALVSLLPMDNEESVLWKWKQKIYVLGLIAAAFMLGDALLGPSIATLAAYEGVREYWHDFPQEAVIGCACGTLILLIFAQRFGTSRMIPYFSPLMITWFLAILLIGAYNISYTPGIWQVVSPHWIFKYAAGDPERAFSVLGN
ncbi:hypothetical protein HDV00_005866, partial [Rhizophlyctis rosea]